MINSDVLHWWMANTSILAIFMCICITISKFFQKEDGLFILLAIHYGLWCIILTILAIFGIKF